MSDEAIGDIQISFDTLRYLDAWANLIERYGKENTIVALIVWQTLNGWRDPWPNALVHVFGFDIEPIAKRLREHAPELRGRFTLIEGKDYPERLRAYCDRILEVFKPWSLYDP